MEFFCHFYRKDETVDGSLKYIMFYLNIPYWIRCGISRLLKPIVVGSILFVFVLYMSKMENELVPIKYLHISIYL